MASIAYYSPLFALAPNRGQAAYAPKSANLKASGDTVTYEFVVTPGAALLNTDVVHLIPAVPAGTRVQSLTLKNDDLDSGATVTFNLGWTASASTFLSGSTLFQSANTGTALTAAQVMGQTAAVAGDELIITMSADSTTAGTITVQATLYIP